MSVSVAVHVTRTLQVDPTDMRPGDVVVSLSDHDISGCHCDVVVTVRRIEPAWDILAGLGLANLDDRIACALRDAP